MKLSTVANAVGSAVSGGYVHIEGYHSDKHEVSTILGHICPNYGESKKRAIKELDAALTAHTLQPIRVTGKCYNDNGVWNSRKKSCPLKDYDIIYTVAEVEEAAKGILESWQNPVKRTSNEIALTEKGNRGLLINLETGRIQFDLLIEREVYNESASDTAKLDAGAVAKVEASMPDTKLKTAIREQFQRKMKTFVLEQGKFETLSINGIRFASKEIEF